ncbi:hypothetical protein GP486_002689 [Trichoglossum hirsutum]|uniref:Uncharacterized protein n=1 Tax=Trichoglossum hirsutum TaxID=265104 RepID=A0A9P8LEG2_9PEZI|nr:hypothetical protein GP486_002689 [Trichoglossum hirsutum]
MFSHAFDFTNIQLQNNPFPMPRDLPRSDILQPLQPKAQSAANAAAATAVPGAISKVESVAKSATTALPNADAVREPIPRNFSLGTKQLCVGFSNRAKCKNLPLKISGVIPEHIAKIIGDRVEELHLEQISAKITSTNIQNYLILGLVLIVLMAIMAVIFACSMFSRLSRLFRCGGVLTR